MSLDGDLAVVGAQTDDDLGNASGTASVFGRDDMGTPSDLLDDVWVEEAKLTSSDAAPEDLFGSSVSTPRTTDH